MRTLANFLNDEPDVPVLSRSGTFNVQNGLCMQADFHLESDLQSTAREDAVAVSTERRDLRNSYLELQKSLSDSESFRWEKILETQRKA